ncbi:MAG: nitroreductase family protein [Oscillospiraceae bacterium]|jgi:nitroreductase|nr:nitroreductase family protein [Oscillospiraceae bacterium]
MANSANSANAVIQTIHARRSTRKYTAEQITEEQLDTLLDAAIWAPSGSDCQTWQFTAIQKEDVLLKINELVKEGLRVWTPNDDYASRAAAIRQNAQKAEYNFYYRAPTLILTSNRPNYENGLADNALALQNVFLTAESVGLGSCYINQLRWTSEYAPLRDYLAELGIPREHVLFGAAAVGHIDTATPTPERKPNTVKKII